MNEIVGLADIHAEVAVIRDSYIGRRPVLELIAKNELRIPDNVPAEAEPAVGIERRLACVAAIAADPARRGARFRLARECRKAELAF